MDVNTEVSISFLIGLRDHPGPGYAGSELTGSNFLASRCCFSWEILLPSVFDKEGPPLNGELNVVILNALQRLCVIKSRYQNNLPSNPWALFLLLEMRHK